MGGFRKASSVPSPCFPSGADFNTACLSFSLSTAKHESLLVLKILTLNFWNNILQIPSSRICTNPCPSSAGVTSLKKLEVDRHVSFHHNTVDCCVL